MKPALKNPFTLLKDENLRRLQGIKKMQYILDYYKLPLVILCIFLYIVGYIIYNKLSYKDTVLSAALVNVNAGETLTKELTDDFLEYLSPDPSQSRTELYTGLYLTDDESSPDHQYTYASGMKVLALVEGESLDVVLMNKEAFDALSLNGFLCDLEVFLLQEDPALYERIKSDIVINTVILEDNSIDASLDPSVAYSAVTEEHPFGVDLSKARIIRQAGFQEPVYLGIIANSPRKKTAAAYLGYLYFAGQPEN